MQRYKGDPFLKQFFIILALLFFIVSVVGFFNDFKKAWFSLEYFDKIYLLFAAVFGFGNDFVKFFRWHLYIRKLKINIDFLTDLRVFLCGLSMSVTPAKFGYTIKNYIIENITRMPFKRTLSATFAEMYMDFLMLSSISFFGMFYLKKISWVGIFLIAAVNFIFYPKVFRKIFIELRGILPYSIKRHYSVLKDMSSFFSIILFWEVTAITLCAWVSEGVSLHFVLMGFGYDMTILKTTIIFGFATFVGSISMLPGGIVAADLTLFGLLVFVGIPAYISIASTVLARIFTLWLSVIIGNGALFINRKKFFGENV